MENDKSKKESWFNIPQFIANKDMSWAKKALCGKILSLQSKKGYCYASNEYLAKCMSTSERTIERHLSSLLDDKLVRREYDEKGERRLFLNFSPDTTRREPTNTSGNQPTDMSGTHPTNTSGIQNSNRGKKEERIDNSARAKKVYKYWNNQKETITHRKLTDGMESTLNARLEDGWSVEEMQNAVDNYCMLIRDSKYYWSHDSWTLEEFFKRGGGEKANVILQNPDSYKRDDIEEEEEDEIPPEVQKSINKFREDNVT